MRAENRNRAETAALARVPSQDLMVVTILALVVRIVWHLFVPVRDWPDTAVYQATGHALLSTGAMSSGNYMPLYPLAISVLGPNGILILQGVVSALSAAVVQLISFDLFRSRLAAFLAGLMAALSPSLVFYAHMRLTETIYIALLLLAFLSFYRGRFAVGSVCVVLSILTRPTLDLLAPLLIVAFCIARRETGLRTVALRLGLYALVYGALMAPWWWHNWNLYHTFVRLDLGMGNLLVIENSALFDRVGLDFQALAPAWERFNGIADPIARDRAMVDAALHYITSDPIHWLQRCMERFLRFWNPMPGSDSAAVNAISFVTVVPVYGLAVFALLRLSFQQWLLIVPILLLAAYLTAIHTVTHGIPRYRLPLEPFLIILASFSLAEGLTAIVRRRA
ncbi:hypothetical protein [Microvirga pudoricolor]|uniref:hypothetical protein n=1 Tax=Microvirga pudoricolor TaxID=2778729 RepID=UPI001950B770|nr:hypothetical protein [Microvirga pudoricolor]MBM6594215.1 hypothetical protein [Microvirga pudoricolor]